ITGPDSKFGVNATLAALGDLKEEYITEGGALESEDEKAERRLEAMVRKFAGVRLTARVLAGSSYGLRVWGDAAVEAPLAALADAGVSLRWHLLTRADLGAATVSTSEATAAAVNEVPLTDITPFIVLVAEDDSGRTRR